MSDRDETAVAKKSGYQDRTVIDGNGIEVPPFVFPPEMSPDDGHQCICGPDYGIGELEGWCSFCFGVYPATPDHAPEAVNA